MVLDIILVLILILAIYNGIKNGAVVTVFSFISIFIGIIVALKFSNLVALWLGQIWKLSTSWLPHLAFILVFLLTILLVRLLGKLIKNIASALLLGWIDKIIGILINAFCYIIVFSIFIFYCNVFHLISKSIISSSKTYSYIEPLGRSIINNLGHVFSWLKQLNT